MRDEYRKIGILTETDEIRESFDLATMRSVIAYMPENEMQNTHRHSMVVEAIHILAGQVDVWNKGQWKPLSENQVAIFERNEYHNLRTAKKINKIDFPSSDHSIAAVTLAYKWIPPNLEIHSDEIDLVLDYDWFHLDYEPDTYDKTTSPLLRSDEATQKKFWNILERNNL